jgi:hypothetical protein
MTSFPRSPRLTKGAIVSLDLPSPIPKVIVFHYNPDLLTRTLQAQTVGGGGGGGEGEDRSEAFRLKRPPVETISLEIEFDATDQLAHPDENKTAASIGIHPQLAALEMILYPKSSSIIENSLLSSLGTLEILPPEGPLTLFIWGAKRVLPVRITDFRVTEEAFDTKLNPIRAKVSLTLRVLSYADLTSTHPGHALYLTHQVVKETMAAIGTINSLSAIDTSAGNLRLL